MNSRLTKTSGVIALTAALLLPAVPAPAQAQASDEFLGQLMYTAFSFAPKGWALCNGQTLPIAQNQALFSLLGTTYGGNGTTNFQLPNMQGRAPLHFSNSFNLGQVGGSEATTLLTSNMPIHSHTVSATVTIPASSASATTADPNGHYLAATTHTLNYTASSPNVSLSSQLSVSGNTSAGGSSQPLSIMPPYVTVNCVIALVGIFPSRN